VFFPDLPGCASAGATLQEAAANAEEVRGERPGRSLRINVSLDEGLIAAIDRVAKNRSGFLADAARAALAARQIGM
jgi:hypothetical protein